MSTGRRRYLLALLQICAVYGLGFWHVWRLAAGARYGGAVAVLVLLLALNIAVEYAWAGAEDELQRRGE